MINVRAAALNGVEQAVALAVEKGARDDQSRHAHGDPEQRETARTATGTGHRGR